jgi:molybdopterin molybdotransferase
VVPRAAEARAGEEIVPSGRRLGVPEIALAASCGLAKLEVFCRPTVALVATGDELVEPGAAPEPWQIRNSNSHALAALVREAGGEPRQLAIARDTEADLEARLLESAGADLLLLSGGVSAGKYDLVEDVLARHGARFFFTGTLIQPGKPLVFGRLPRTSNPRISNQGAASSEVEAEAQAKTRPTYFFGLPGNPVSTEVCFRLFVAPLLRALSGQSEISPRFVEAKLGEVVRGGARVTRFLPATLTTDWQAATVKLVPWQGSGDLAANARANCFAVLPAEVPGFAAGETVRVLLR